MTWPGWTPELDEAWRTVAWWHRTRPPIEIDYTAAHGPIGWGLVTIGRPSRFVPEHVKEARRLLGFPRINRTEGERP
jgi:hypothetical protein